MVADHVLRDEAGRVPGVLIRERLRLVDGVGQGQKRVEYRQVRVGRSVGARGLGLEGWKRVELLPALGRAVDRVPHL